MANAPFKTPAVWIVAPLGALVCLAMIAGLGLENWARLIVWLLVGFAIYFGYSRYHSKVRHGEVIVPKDPEMPKEPFEK